MQQSEGKIDATINVEIVTHAKKLTKCPLTHIPFYVIRFVSLIRQIICDLIQTLTQK